MLERIELLCSCGAGIEAIASPVTAAVRDYLGAQSGSIFWLDENRVPGGFYHDSAPPEIKDIFVTRLDELFLIPGEVSILSLSETDGPSIGQTLMPGYMDHFWQGNVYRYLAEPRGHRWMLDMRVEVDGIGRIVFCAWNPAERPFDHDDADALQPVQHMLQRAVSDQHGTVRWRSLNQSPAHLLTDVRGQELLAIDAEAERILTTSHLLRQHISMAGPVNSAPGFVTALAAQAAEGRSVMHVPVTDGRIVAQATPARGRNGTGNAGTMLSVSLDLQVAADVLMVDRVSGLSLSPKQRKIALFAMRGGSRAACSKALEVSEETLKKHLRTIFAETGTARWSELAELAR
jgi:DNA-binding CsgD family transcriptional regulator